MTPSVRYPGGAITPTGSYHLLRGDKPHMTYTSYDGDVVFDLLGPLSSLYSDRTLPAITLISMKGIWSQWKQISQKGATQDGETFVTSLYEPIDASMVVEAYGRTSQLQRRVSNDWLASWDAIRTGELAYYTHELGRWWADVRWTRDPVEDIRGGMFTRQRFTWPFKVYDAFWRSYPDVAEFRSGNGSTFLPRLNIGDQPMFDTYTCVGPGTFTFADGPSATETVEFGPLLANQVAQIRTDPRKRGVVDLSTNPAAQPSPEQRSLFQAIIDEFLSFGLALLQGLMSLFGCQPIPPQGPLYSLLHGRFSDRAAIPAKPTGGPAVPYSTKVTIAGGNSDSRIVAVGVPLRRFPY